MIVALTGGTGFIGHNLIKKHLLRGDEVRLLSRKAHSSNTENLNFFLGDLSDNKVNLSSFVNNVDILYHCAGELLNENLMMKLHIDGTKKLVHEAEGKINRWIQLGSVGSYGEINTGIVTEESPEAPLGVYELSKNESDKIIKNSNIPFTILRPSNIIGASMTNQSLFKLIKCVEKKLFFYFSDKDVLMNYVDVDDVAEALILCGSNKKAIGKTYILSQSIELKKMISVLTKTLKVKNNFFTLPESQVRLLTKLLENIPTFPLTTNRINALTGCQSYQSDKIINDLSFKFKSPLEESLRLIASQK